MFGLGKEQGGGGGLGRLGMGEQSRLLGLGGEGGQQSRLLGLGGEGGQQSRLLQGHGMQGGQGLGEGAFPSKDWQVGKYRVNILCEIQF